MIGVNEKELSEFDWKQNNSFLLFEFSDKMCQYKELHELFQVENK